jgi:phosphoribosylaminoimidazole-succinocarboxamide synthase
LVATDRLSCFDRILTTIPFKGQVLTGVSSFWFNRVKGDIPTHFIDQIDPCVMMVKGADVIPFEVVVRGYLAGSAWRAYKAGLRVPGLELPIGLSEFDKLPCPVVTPSTKEFDGGHDTPVSREQIISSGIISKAEWDWIEKTALELFSEGQLFARSRGLILADTKYEFGRIGDKIILIDEIHTLDSSRYWEISSFDNLREQGGAPRMLDKEPIRRWLMDHGYHGEGEPPLIPDRERLAISHHYVSAYERLTGERLSPDRSDPLIRIVSSLSKAGFSSSRP